MTNLDSILKSRDITFFANKDLSSQGYGFSSGHIWRWELDCKQSWTPKNWCFWTVVLEKTLESPSDSKRSNQSILKEIVLKYSLEGLMLKLKLQYFGHLMWRAKSFKTGWKLGLMRQTAKSWEQRISSWRKLKELLPQNKHKQAYK